MTIAQIAAILALLSAFNVPASTISTVEDILTHKSQQTVEIATSTVSLTIAPVIAPVNNAPVLGGTITAPMPTPPKLLTLQIGQPGLANGQVTYEVRAFYETPGAIITLESADGGTFTNISPIDLGQLDTATGAADDPRGLFKGSVKIKAHTMGEKIGVYAIYTPKGENVTIKATAEDGAEAIVSGHSQKKQPRKRTKKNHDQA